MGFMRPQRGFGVEGLVGFHGHPLWLLGALPWHSDAACAKLAVTPCSLKGSGALILKLYTQTHKKT